MKYIKTLLFIIVVSFAAKAQNFKVDSIIIEGKKYWIYPYKFEWENAEDYRTRYDYDDYNFSTTDKLLLKIAELRKRDYDYDVSLANTNIPPVLDSLPDGSYIMYYAFKPTVKKWKRKLHLVKQPIGAYFEMKNNLLNGKISYLSYEGVVKEEGEMKDGLRSGEWKNRNDNSAYESFYVLQYKDDIQQGREEKYKVWISYGKEQLYLVSEREYDEKGFVNYYKEYDDFGALRLQAQCDTATFLTYNNNLTYLNGYYSYVPDSIVKHFEFYLSLKTKKERKKYLRYYEDWYKFQWSYRPFEFESTPAVTPFKVFHSNGKLAGNFSYEALPRNKKSSYVDDYRFDKNYELVFDTVYNAEGGVAIVRKPMTDSLGQKRFMLCSYNASGRLWQRTLHVLDSNFHYQAYSVEYLTDSDTMMLFSLDYSNFYKIDSSFFKSDSLLLRGVNKDYYFTKTYIASKIPDVTFTDAISLYYPTKFSFKILRYDNPYQYYTQADFGDFSVRKYFSYDTTGVLKTRPGAVLRCRLFSDYEVPTDSSIVYFKGKRYTGGISYSNDLDGDKLETRSFINFDGDTIKYSNYYFQKKGKLIFPSNGEQVCDLNFVNGIIQSAVEYSYSGERKTVNFKDHAVDGVVKSYDYKKRMLGKKKFLVKEEPYVNGSKNGVEKEWACHECDDNSHYYEDEIDMAKPKKKELYFLHSVDHYFNGSLVDTSFVFYSSGKISSIAVYDSLGNKNGVEAEFDDSGRMLRCEHFVNGLSEGHRWAISWQGDTTNSGYTFMGVNEGPYYAQFFDYLTNENKGRVDGNFAAGAPVGKWITVSGFGTKRFEVDIDTCYNTKSYYSGMLSDFNEMSGLDIEGTFSIYHPNGVLYTSGKTYIDYDVVDYGFIDTVYHSRKIGKWKYYNNVGRLTHEIDYKKANKTIEFASRDTSNKTTYKEYYSNGNLKYEGEFLHEDKRLDCATDIEEPQFFVIYKTYLSETGDTLVKEGSGKIKTFYADGSLFMEGEIVDGREQGWWKTYNKEGVLIEVGKYVNGMQDGRWLKGDLTGVNYTDDQCFQNEEEKLKEHEENKNLIDLELSIYKEGLLINSYHYFFRRTE